MAGRSKQFARPPKKQKKSKAAQPQTADEFQEAADFEEETGGKWRAGDPAKSGRAFVRALDIYDNGLGRHPQSFDLAYNKARLMLEITQQPVLVDKIGLPLIDLLKKTLDAHRVAQGLNGDNPDVLFNTSQVLTSLAEQLSAASDDANAIHLLQEALELLSACLSKQEMLLEQLEQQRKDFDDAQEQEGGVTLDPERPIAGPEPSDDSGESGEYALVETPISPSDLLDTVQASLSALTTLVSITTKHNFSMLASLAQQLCDEKAPAYINLLSDSDRDPARLAVAVSRANFAAANADAQFNAWELELQTYIERLDEAFNLPAKDQDFDILLSEGQARMEVVLSVLDRGAASQSDVIETCWKQLAASQNILSAASKLKTTAAKEGSATLFERKGSVELLRHRLATSDGANEAWLRSAPTLLLNSQTYFVGGFKHAQVLDEPDIAKTTRLRWLVATMLQKVMYGGTPKVAAPFSLDVSKSEILKAAQSCVEEGLIDNATAERVFL